MNENIVCVIIGQNCRNTIDVCIESVKDADAIVYLDGGSEDMTLEYLYDKGFGDNKNEGRKNYNIIHNQFDSSDSLMISKQRNFYLKYLKNHYKDYWCLVLDADEVLDSLTPFRKLINKHKWKDNEIFNPRMRHLINNLVTEDATQVTHFVPRRFFKITNDKFYPDGEHTTLESKKESVLLNFEEGLIWHLGYLGGVWDVKKRFDDQILRKESNTHSVEFLNKWKNAHVFGLYPTKQFSPIELPELILGKFGIDKDELYFANRNLEVKHFIDAIHWKEFFKCKNIVEWGCGKGPRIYAMNNIGLNAHGFELSNFAVKNKMHDFIKVGDITKGNNYKGIELSIAYDVLEHINYEDLDNAIKILMESKKYILISVPFKGTSNCDNDPTHIIKEDREWWIKQFTNKGLKHIPTPTHFLFKEQILIFEVDKE